MDHRQQRRESHRGRKDALSTARRGQARRVSINIEVGNLWIEHTIDVPAYRLRSTMNRILTAMGTEGLTCGDCHDALQERS